MSGYLIKKSTLKDIADALRRKGGTTSQIKPIEMPSYINQNLTATAEVNELIQGTITQFENDTCPYIGSTAFVGCNDLRTVNMPNVSYVDNNAFSGCIALETVNMQNVELISSAAFLGCTALETVSMPNVSYVSTNAFSGCTSIKTIYMPALTNAGSSAFLNCKPEVVTFGVSEINPVADKRDEISKVINANTNLRILNLPDCLIIYSSACSGATALEEINAKQVTKITKDAFTGCTALREIDFPVCELVGATAFKNCTSLEKVYLPKMSSMNQYAFQACPIKIFYAPEMTGQHASDPLANVTTIEEMTVAHPTVPAWYAKMPNLYYYSNSNATATTSNAFSNCTKLTEEGIYLPYVYNPASWTFRNTGFTKIDNEVFPALQGNLNAGLFYQCYNLENVDLPYVSYVNSRVFAYCSNLTRVSLPNISSIYANGSYPAFGGCSALAFANLGKITTVPYYVFNGNSALLGVSLSMVTTLNQSAFQNCSSLSEIKLPRITLIGKSAFVNCSSLSQVHLGRPGLVEAGETEPTFTISTTAFQNCSALSSVFIYYTKVPTLGGSNAFPLSPDLTIYVPSEANPYEKQTNWSMIGASFVSMNKCYIGGIPQCFIPGQTWEDWWNIDGMYANPVLSYEYTYNDVTSYTPDESGVTAGGEMTIAYSTPELIKTTIPGIFYYQPIETCTKTQIKSLSYYTTSFTYASSRYFKVGNPEDLIGDGTYYYPVQISNPFPEVDPGPPVNPEW